MLVRMYWVGWKVGLTVSRRLNNKQVRKALFREAAKHLKGLAKEYQHRTRFFSPYAKELKKVIFLMEEHWGGAHDLTDEEIEEQDEHWRMHHNMPHEEIYE